MKKKSKIIITTIYLFIVLYHPNLKYLIGFNNYLIYLISTLFYFIYVCSQKNNGFFNYMKRKDIWIFIISNLFATLFFATRFWTSYNIVSFNELRIFQGLFPILYLVSALLINCQFNLLKMNFSSKFKFILKVGLIQSLIAIIMMFVPSIKDIAIKIYYQNVLSSDFYNAHYYITQNRLHGLCNGDYTYGLQIQHAFLGLISIIYAFLQKEKKYYLVGVCLLFVTFLNGRTGILLFILGMLIMCINLLGKRKYFIKMLWFTLLGIFSLFIIINVLKNFIPNTYELINHAFNDVTSFFNGNEKSETSSFFNMFFLPTGIAFLIGNGCRVLGTNAYKYNINRSSDVGFVNDMFMGGLIYCWFLYYPFFRMINRTKSNDIFIKIYKEVLILYFIIGNLKGEFLKSQLLIYTFIMFIVILYDYGEKETCDNGKRINICNNSNL